MSLYDGIDIDEKTNGSTSIAGWGSSMKLLETQKHLQEKKQMLQNVIKRKQPANASFTALAPVVDLNSRRTDEGGNLRFNQATGKMERVTLPKITSPFIANEGGQSFLGVTDEYDPLRPNDYDNFVRERKKRKRLKEQEDEDEKEHARRRRCSDDEDTDENHSENSRRSRRKEEPLFGEDREERRRRKRNDDSDEEKKRLAATKAAIAPPPSLMEMDIKPPEIGCDANKKPDPGNKFGLGGSVASKIMARMGYREGQGLGKSEQGMSIALQVEKTSRRGGKIIHERDLHKSQDMSVPRVETSNANLLKNPSKVIVLRNMVGPGEVDENLEGEVAEECSKYGKVIKCTIFEIPDIEEEEAVRIFIEFDRLEQAIKAVVDLNGRFFGGRIVKGNFYNLDKFRRLLLADQID